MKPVKMEINDIDRKNKTVWVKNKKGNVFPCKAQNWLIDDIQLLDKAIVVKSAVSKEWLCVDYQINTSYDPYSDYGEDMDMESGFYDSFEEFLSAEGESAIW